MRFSCVFHLHGVSLTVLCVDGLTWIVTCASDFGLGV